MIPSPAEITKRYLKERQLTLQAFATALGIEIDRQQVYQWREGKHKPSLETLFKVDQSEKAEPWAKAWAGECIAAIAGVRTIVKLDKIQDFL